MRFMTLSTLLILFFASVLFPCRLNSSEETAARESDPGLRHGTGMDMLVKCGKLEGASPLSPRPGGRRGVEGGSSGGKDGENVKLIGRALYGPARAAFSEGDYVYICAENALVIFDITNPQSPVPVGDTYTPGFAYYVHVSGSYAYVADYDDGLRIIDVSDPANPFEAGYYDTGGKARGVHVSGSYAYVADGYAGLRIIDVSDPANPFEAGYYDTGGYARGVHVSGSYAYVADYYDGLRIIDVSDPANPFEAGYYDTGGYACGVHVSGSYAYVAALKDGLYILQFTPDAVEGEEGENALPVPGERLLGQNRPNPFNPITTIEFKIQAAGPVSLAVYDILGKRVESLVEGDLAEGNHAVKWAGTDSSGRAVSSGIYICRLETRIGVETRKMALLK